ncbi:MAG TPA: M23 family metallopeptidase [Pyrinomonadaceae bacterium]|nr:M23 family metallopeptidase [Pyrinomonadaceae bacterium]
MRRLSIYHIAVFAAAALGLTLGAFRYARRTFSTDQSVIPARAEQTTPIVIPVSDGFDYAVGNTRYVTEANDKDGWYNAQDFGENDHLGEDWNAKTGGNTDCGMPVYAVSKGTIVFAAEAGPGWGKVIIVRHRLPDGKILETLYGHLQSFQRTSGEVDRRERIGRLGNADGVYPCHLHLELRLSDCPSWGATGPGYSRDRKGWTDPSDYIDANRSFKRESD